MQVVVDQLVYFAYLQGVFLLAIYGLAPRQRRRVNPWLVGFVACLVLALTSRVAYLSGAFGGDYRLVVASELGTLLFGPTVFLFARSSLRGRGFARADLRHYAAPLAYAALVAATFLLPDDAALAARAERGLTRTLVFAYVGVCLAINVGYYVAAVRVYAGFRQNLPDALSYAVRSRFFATFLAAVGLCLATWVALYGLGLAGEPYFTRPSWQLVWIALALVILFVGYYGLTAPELYRVAPLMAQAPAKYRGSRLTATELDRFRERLDDLMRAQKPYLNRRLAKAELAALLGVSSPDLARLLNERIGMNFFEYVNAFRIREFIRLARAPGAEALTLFGLAQEAGFNSKTTFNKAFRQLTGTSPSAYFAQSPDRP